MYSICRLKDYSRLILLKHLIVINDCIGITQTARNVNRFVANGEAIYSEFKITIKFILREIQSKIFLQRNLLE